MFFAFDENDFTKMVGETGWSNKNYDVIQSGSKNWTGTIKVWDNKDTRSRADLKGSAFGRIEPKHYGAFGHWVQGDRIQLQACGQAGI